ncbi:type IV pilin [Halopenitus sp. H-Gu1]|uniref:type IV pilin n=1 Tax=Halopenitus sp. H-Gu1 TaxID=3242697 RepID=UPI00359D7376
MKITTLFSDERAVSPVIGVILMVAITVILAAVIGTFVLGLGNDLQNTQPTASFNFQYEDNGEGTNDNVTITHAGGDTIDGSSDVVRLTESAGVGFTSGETWTDSSISAGSSHIATLDGDWSGQTVRVNWESANGESSATLATSTAPDYSA